MRFKDQRIKLVNQVLAEIKVLKLYAWEPYFRDKIMELRNKELLILQKIAWLSSVNSVISFSSNAIVALLCFVTYVFTSDHILTPDVAFVSLSLFNVLNNPFFVIPMGVLGLAQGLVSVGRLNEFLLQPEVDPDSVSHNYSDNAITITDGTFTWGGLTILKNINLEVPIGSLVAVVGHVGQGKSSLLSAILGEMEKTSGTINTYGSVAYVPQQAWIQSLTLRDNILFSKSYSKDKYEKIINACALEADLEILEAGDLTEIGEKGINLSGGQKQRVSLARAIYQNEDTYLLDDPLSAVDAHVGKHIFEKVIGPQGFLRNRTRVLVTNAINILPKADRIVVMKEGSVSEMGTYDELLSDDGAFSEFIKNYLQEADQTETDDPELKEQRQDLVQRMNRLSSTDSSFSETELEPLRSQVRKKKRKGSRDSEVLSADEEIQKMDLKKSVLISDENAGEGNDPVLFSGTLRFNLDPADIYSDHEVWESLKQSHLHPFVTSLKEGLNYECGEDGCNLSLGQRQLVCLARALLRKTKILVLDEATAAVDLETDDLIQNTIRTEFQYCTVITIAHRLNTIMDYDRIIVMARGEIKEFDSPDNLLMDTSSIFHGMAKDAGLL